MAKILLVETDKPLADLVARFLEKHGHSVDIDDGLNVVERLVRERPEVCILEVELPGATGFSVTAKARASGYDPPIIFATTRQSVTDEMAALELGADDFIRKPYDPAVLVLRIACILRRCRPNDVWERNGLRIEWSARRVLVHGEVVRLSTGMFELLWLLARNANRIVSRDQYFAEVHGIEYDGMNRSYDSRVRDLRKIMEDAGFSRDRILTVRGEGYQLTVE